ncbi:nuclear transport factor 2 family protein [Pontibacter sp. KCTC 32443]|uniref:nuclear transport factor 2 family protein n=1 Tax=Pontibacter TaxID=323449 RepID=UPI00164E145E|nr:MULTISPECIES: nuclear transport factor 2 family protein [Pontibacter]MBC5774808.1 nuclear transport factor 2 family protein [Pontibacter sp. KCTC 32443]
MKISREEVLSIEAKLIEAIKSSDIKFLDSILYDDLLFIAPNGQVITKQMDLDSHRAGEMLVEQLLPTIEEVKIVDDTAIVIVVYDTKGTMLGNPIEGQFRYLRIWKQFSDGLKVIGGSCFKLT